MNIIVQSSRKITSLGGLNFALEAFKKLDLSKTITKFIGSRSGNVIYSYTDIFQSLFANSLTQGEFLSDIGTLKEKFKGQISWKCPSADTVEFACQELKKPNTTLITATNIQHDLNHNNLFNKLLINTAIQTKGLIPGNEYDMDFDNVVIANEKQDARRSYKQCNGYHPSFATIGRIPIHVENRNGNTPAKYGQVETLRRCFENTKEFGIKIKNFRADSASFQTSVINLVDKEVAFFYIRNMNSAAFREICTEAAKWEVVRIGNEYKEVASVEYSPKGCEKTYRVVVTRSKVKNGQTDLFTGEYTYYGIITNDRTQTNVEVILFYNQRADSENTNRFLLNDFNLNHLPFSDMDTNTVYMYFMAMCATLFEWFKKVLIQNKTPRITLSMRTKAVCYHYISVASEWIKRKGEEILVIYSDQKYTTLTI
jgi:hypothetical protein